LPAPSAPLVTCATLFRPTGTLSYATLATQTSHVGSYAVTPSGLSSNDYDITFAAGTLNITPAALTITAPTPPVTYANPNPTLASTQDRRAGTDRYDGLVNADTAASPTGTLSYATLATQTSHVGSYAVTPSGLSSNDYDITFAAGTLNITPAALTITAPSPTVTYGDPKPSLA